MRVKKMQAGLWQDTPFVRPRHRWKDSIKTYLKETMVGHGMQHVYVLQYRDKWWALVNTVINCQVP